MMQPVSSSLLAAGIALLGARGAAASTACPRNAPRERLACSACHVAVDGGPLTAFGRDYYWRAPAQVAEGSGANHGSSEDGPGGAEAAGERTANWGRWSGEAIFWARTGGSRVQGERQRDVALTESLRLQGNELFGDERISFSGEGFARQGFADETGGMADDGASFSTAAVTVVGATGDSYARLGRQFVATGAAVRRVDGLALRTPLGPMFEADLFGGVPSDNAFGGVSGDLIAGGRFGARVGREFRAGFSGFYAKDAGDPSDVKGGLDLEWTPARQVDLLGHVFYDWVADRLYDARVHAAWTPSLEWQVAADWTYAVPGLFLPKNSIFSVFSVDEYEETGVTATRRLDERLSMRGFARYTAYAGGDELVQLGGGVDRRYGPNGEDAIGGEIAWQDESRDDLGGSSTDGDALFLRGYHLLWWTAAIRTSLDASIQIAANHASGRDATLIAATLGYDPRGWWDVECGADWVRDQEFEDRVDFFARMRVRF